MVILLICDRIQRNHRRFCEFDVEGNQNIHKNVKYVVSYRIMSVGTGECTAASNSSVAKLDA